MRGWRGGGVDRRWAEMCFRVGKRRGEEEFPKQAKQSVVQNHPRPLHSQLKVQAFTCTSDGPAIDIRGSHNHLLRSD